MPLVTAEDGVRIHYEVEGPESGTPLVLMHGTGGSLENWRSAGYVDALKHRFRLVLVDSRGHGESDKPLAQEAYELRGRAMDLVAVLNAEGIQRGHLLGYSMGGWIAWGCLIYTPQRFASLAIGGFGPVPDPYFGKSADEFFGTRLAALSADEQRALRGVFAETERFGGARQALKATSMPILLFAGAADPRFASVRDAAATAHRPFLALPGKDHLGAQRDPDSRDAIVARLTAFIDEVEAASK